MQVENIKKGLNDFKSAIQAAREKQKAANEECKKLERDMAEFKNNKEGKIDELKVGSSKYAVPFY
jgi:structural maintenance of chromosome 2